MANWKETCLEFLKGCSNAPPDNPQECKECLDAFVNNLVCLKKEENVHSQIIDKISHKK